MSIIIAARSLMKSFLHFVRARCSEMVNCSRILLESFTAKKANEIFDTRDSVK